MIGKVFTALLIIAMIIMGTPLTANEPGNDCVVCWGPGKPFGNAATPLVVKLTLTALSPGEFFITGDDSFLIGPHLLEQTGAPCVYTIDSGDYRFRVAFLAGNTVVLVAHLPTAHGVFDNTLAPPCELEVPNLLVNPANTVMFGGSAMITWSTAGL